MVHIVPNRAQFAAQFFFALILSSGTSWAGPPQPLTVCGQQLDGRYFLSQDLDCTGQIGHGVDLLGKNARLELRGFTLSNASASGVQCRHRCKIIGPGVISGNALHGVRAGRVAKISDVSIVSNGGNGVDVQNNAGKGRAILRDAHVEDNGTGVFAERRVKLKDSAIVANQNFGVIVSCATGKTKIKNSTVTGNGTDFDCF